MPVLITRTRVKPEAVAAVEAAGRRLFASIAEARPAHVRCATARMADGVTFVTLLELDDGVENPLPSMTAFRDLQALLQASVAEPPVAGPATVIGDYGVLARGR
jgi:hypothetical protein